MSSQEVVDFIRERLKDPVKQAKLSLICEEVSLWNTWLSFPFYFLLLFSKMLH